jgi:hypothetical protein
MLTLIRYVVDPQVGPKQPTFLECPQLVLDDVQAKMTDLESQLMAKGKASPR